MSRFSSPFAEREYLRNESPIEVFKYLDSLSGEYVEERLTNSPPILPKDTQEMLFLRNDRLIDIGLVKLADKSLIESILRKYNPADTHAYETILTSAFYSSALGNLYKTPTWLASRIQWIAETSNPELISVLLKNPILSKELIQQILDKKDWCENLNSERYLSMLWSLLENKIIQTPPDDDLKFHDIWQHNIISGCWMLLIRLENSQETARLLSEHMSKFQKFEVPSSYQKTEEHDSGDQKSKAIKTKKKYLKEIQKKWHVEPKEDHTFDVWSWNCDRIRSLAVEKIAPNYLMDLKDFIHSSGDLPFIEGYYAGVYLSSVDVDNFESLYKKYGASFLNGLIRNGEIFLKSKHSNTMCLKVFKAAQEFQAPDSMDVSDRPISVFYRTLKLRRNEENPEKYISDISDLDLKTKMT